MIPETIFEKDFLNKFKELAEEFYNSLESKTVNRVGNGYTETVNIVVFKEDTKETYKDIMFKIHNELDGRSPDDYIFEAVEDILDCILDNIDDVNDIDELRDVVIENVIESIYNYDLRRWLMSNINNEYYFDTVLEEYGCDSFEQALGCAFGLFQQDIVNNLINLLEKETEKEFNN